MEELILIRITGEDRPGLTACIMNILASHDVDIQDIGQAVIHSTLSLGILTRVSEQRAGHVMNVKVGAFALFAASFSAAAFSSAV